MGVFSGALYEQPSNTWHRLECAVRVHTHNYTGWPKKNNTETNQNDKTLMIFLVQTLYYGRTLNK